MGRECPSACHSSYTIKKDFYERDMWGIHLKLRNGLPFGVLCDVSHGIAQNAWPSFATLWRNSPRQPQREVLSLPLKLRRLYSEDSSTCLNYLARGLPNWQFQNIGLTICGGDELTHETALCSYNLTGSTSLKPKRTSGKDPKIVSFNTHPCDQF